MIRSFSQCRIDLPHKPLSLRTLASSIIGKSVNRFELWIWHSNFRQLFRDQIHVMAADSPPHLNNVQNGLRPIPGSRKTYFGCNRGIGTGCISSLFTNPGKRLPQAFETYPASWVSSTASADPRYQGKQKCCARLPGSLASISVFDWHRSERMAFLCSSNVSNRPRAISFRAFFKIFLS